MNIDRIIYKNARDIFRRYFGSKFFMWHEGELKRYELYHVPQKIENKWRRELQQELKDKLLKEEGFLNITLIFSNYGMVSADLGDSEGIDFMKEYISEKKSLFDTQTLRICLDDLMSAARGLKYEKQQRELLLWILDELQAAQKREITISDDYLIYFNPGAEETPLETAERALKNTISECKRKLGKLEYYGSDFTVPIDKGI